MPDLQDLVDRPSEGLECELKEWLDLNDRVVKANLARHIAALANHGGGYILIGFRDDGEALPPGAVDPASFTRDAINGIVERYLAPAFHCNVDMVTGSASQIAHPVIWIPSHGVTPICARADGPHDERQRPQGIRMGSYYVRAPGPKSEPIVDPQGWEPLIARCVTNGKDQLLERISTILSGRTSQTTVAAAPLKEWDRRAAERYLQVLTESQGGAWPTNIQTNHYRLSYRIVRTDEREELPIRDFHQLLTETNLAVRELVWTGWSMLYPFTRDEIRPYVIPENVDGRETDVWECSLLNNRGRETGMPDFWRFCGLGYASIVRGYREDRPVDRARFPRDPGTWLSPVVLVREVAELVRHAAMVARRFQTATHVEVCGSWVGLRDRTMGDFDPGVEWHPRRSHADGRQIEGRWSIEEVVADWPRVVSTLAAPVLRLFDGFESSDQWVRSIENRFRQM